jgi:hypothetical protein
LYFDPYPDLDFDFDAEPCRPGSATPCTVDSPVLVPIYTIALLYYNYTDNLNQSKNNITLWLSDGFNCQRIDSNETYHEISGVIELVNNIHSMITSFQDKNFAFKREQTPSLQIPIHYVYTLYCISTGSVYISWSYGF